MIELARRSWLSAFAQTAPFAVISWWARVDRTRTHYEKHWSEMIVLEEAGAIAGLLQVIEAEINGLWVHPSRQGEGVGTRLLRKGEQIVTDDGHEAAWLTCSAYNTRALAFYGRRGYAETGRTRYVHESGVELVDVTMEHRF